jgi:hypothetical protein
MTSLLSMSTVELVEVAQHGETQEVRGLAIKQLVRGAEALRADTASALRQESARLRAQAADLRVASRAVTRA